MRMLIIVERIAWLMILLSQVADSKRKSSQDLEKYFAASTEDTAVLFQLEKELWEVIKRYNESSASTQDRERISRLLSDTVTRERREGGNIIMFRDKLISVRGYCWLEPGLGQ